MPMKLEIHVRDGLKYHNNSLATASKRREAPRRVLIFDSIVRNNYEHTHPPPRSRTVSRISRQQTRARINNSRTKCSECREGAPLSNGVDAPMRSSPALAFLSHHLACDPREG